MRSKIAVSILFMMMTLHIGNMPVFASDTESGGGSSWVREERSDQKSQKRDKIRKKMRAIVKKKSCSDSKDCLPGVDCCERSEGDAKPNLDSTLHQGTPKEEDGEKGDH